MSAYNVFPPQKLNIGFPAFLLLILLIDVPFSVFKTASAAEYIVNGLLRHDKSRVFFRLGFINQ